MGIQAIPPTPPGIIGLTFFNKNIPVSLRLSQDFRIQNETQYQANLLSDFRIWWVSRPYPPPRPVRLGVRFQTWHILALREYFHIWFELVLQVGLR